MFKVICALTLFSVVLAKKKVHFLKANETSKYYISEDVLQFEDARTACKNNGWTLATEKTAEDSAALSADIALLGNSKAFYWLGGFQQYDEKNNSKWIWIDSGEEFNYTNWQQDEPYFDPAYNCLIKQSLLIYKGKWGSEMYNDPYGGSYFICQEPEES